VYGVQASLFAAQLRFKIPMVSNLFSCFFSEILKQLSIGSELQKKFQSKVPGKALQRSRVLPKIFADAIRTHATRTCKKTYM
jgi:hypothetical protein